MRLAERFSSAAAKPLTELSRKTLAVIVIGPRGMLPDCGCVPAKNVHPNLHFMHQCGRSHWCARFKFGGIESLTFNKEWVRKPKTRRHSAQSTWKLSSKGLHLVIIKSRMSSIWWAPCNLVELLRFFLSQCNWFAFRNFRTPSISHPLWVHDKTLLIKMASSAVPCDWRTARLPMSEFRICCQRNKLTCRNEGAWIGCTEA